jgi:hypothetical protein
MISNEDAGARMREDAGRMRLEGALSHRIDEVEREYRRLKRINMSLMVGIAILLGLGVALVSVSSRYGVPGTVADLVAAKQFVVRGDDGVVRGIWGTAEDGTIRLMLQDSAARARVKLDLLADGSSGLTFADSAGHARAVFAFLPDQTASLVLADAAQRTRAVLGISADGSPTILFADRFGGTRAGLGVDDRGAGTLTLVDREGRTLGDLEPEEPPTPTEPDTTPAAPPAPARRR